MANFIEQLWENIDLGSSESAGNRAVKWPGGKGGFYVSGLTMAGTAHLGCEGFRHPDMSGLDHLEGTESPLLPVTESGTCSHTADGVLFFWAPAGATLKFHAYAESESSLQFDQAYVAQL
jgi:hypothetical protein